MDSQEKVIIASGPVIIEDGKLLVIKEDKDDFYKLPGGRVEEKDTDLEKTCRREFKEEVDGELEIIKPLHPILVRQNQSTGEKMTIILIHYLCKLKNKFHIRPILPIKELKWLDISEIIKGKYHVATNIKFLIAKGDIK